MQELQGPATSQERDRERLKALLEQRDVKLRALQKELEQERTE